MVASRDAQEEKKEHKTEAKPSALTEYQFRNPIYKKLMDLVVLNFEEKDLLRQNIVEYFNYQIILNVGDEFKRASEFTTLIPGGPTSLSVSELPKLSRYLKVISNHMLENKMLIEMILFMQEYLRLQNSTLNAKNSILLMFSCARYAFLSCLASQPEAQTDFHKFLLKTQEFEFNKFDDCLRAFGLEDSFLKLLDDKLSDVLNPAVGERFVITWKSIKNFLISLDKFPIRNALIASNRKQLKYAFTVLLQPSNGANISNFSNSELFTEEDYLDFYCQVGTVIANTMNITDSDLPANEDRCKPFYQNTQYIPLTADKILRRFHGVATPEDIVSMLALIDRFFNIFLKDSLNPLNIYSLITVVLYHVTRINDDLNFRFLDFFAKAYISFKADSAGNPVVATPKEILETRNLIVKLENIFFFDVLGCKTAVVHRDDAPSASEPIGEYSDMLDAIDTAAALPKYSQNGAARVRALQQSHVRTELKETIVVKVEEDSVSGESFHIAAKACEETKHNTAQTASLELAMLAHSSLEVSLQSSPVAGADMSQIPPQTEYIALPPTGFAQVFVPKNLLQSSAKEPDGKDEKKNSESGASLESSSSKTRKRAREDNPEHDKEQEQHQEPEVEPDSSPTPKFGLFAKIENQRRLPKHPRTDKQSHRPSSSI